MKFHQHLLDHNFPIQNFKKLSPTQKKKQIQQNHVVYVQKVKPERNLDISAKNVKIILLYV